MIEERIAALHRVVIQLGKEFESDMDLDPIALVELKGAERAIWQAIEHMRVLWVLRNRGRAKS